jgi:hypothetical protein
VHGAAADRAEVRQLADGVLRWGRRLFHDSDNNSPV